MALERQRELVGGDAAAVVRDADEGLAAVGDGDLDPGRASVDGVLDQLLDGRGRALDHLAGGDAVDDGLGKLADGHGFPR